MLSIKQLVTIDSPWTAMAPLRLGKIPSGLGTAELFVTISDGDRALLRVDLYGDSSSESCMFQDALVWCESVFVGFGHSVYVIDPKTQSASRICLGPFWATSNISTQARITCWSPPASLCCGSRLAVRSSGGRQISASMV